MAIAEFPPVDSADESGLLAIGGDMEVESLILAYTNGIFPWPIQEDYPLTWFSPDPRGVITIENFKVSKSLKRFLNQSPYEIKVNSNFNRVIEECAKIPRKGQSSTWIFP
jgi:leucyl/phenylalanyl-tRNA--protein transferase